MGCVVRVQVLGGGPLAGIALPAAPQVAAQDAGEDQEQVGRPQSSQDHAHNLQQARLHDKGYQHLNFLEQACAYSEGALTCKGACSQLTSPWVQEFTDC